MKKMNTHQWREIKRYVVPLNEYVSVRKGKVFSSIDDTKYYVPFLGPHCSYFRGKTMTEAKAWLMKFLEEKLERKEKQIERELEKIRRIRESMKKRKDWIEEWRR